MKKISTLYKKNPSNLALVIDEVSPENAWVFTDDDVIATRKFDGTACMIKNGELYKRYDLKRTRKTNEFPQVPVGAIPCQEPDQITGHWPHWIKCDRNDPSNKYHFEGFDNLIKDNLADDGTYELLGPKVQGNPEELGDHHLFRHGVMVLDIAFKEYTFNMFKNYLEYTPLEGIVFHHPDGRMCKLRKSDFGFKR